MQIALLDGGQDAGKLTHQWYLEAQKSLCGLPPELLEWVTEYFAPQHVADPTAVLFAVRGLRDDWDAETKGYLNLQPDMTFQWRYDQDRQYGYLLKRKVDGKSNDRAIEQAIQELMLQPPRRLKEEKK